MNDHDVKDFLTSASAVNPLGPIDSARLVERGRRGRRRRRLVAGTGGVAAVAAIAVGAALLPDLGSGRADSPVATPSTTSTSATAERRVPSPYLEAIPGLPDGDAALGTLTRAEATRRCHVRFPDVKRTLSNMVSFRGGQDIAYDNAAERCVVPGDSRATAAGRAWLASHPLPRDDAGLLLNCSLRLWHDVRSWRIVAKDSAPGLMTSLVALSPSGRFAVLCRATADGTDGGSGGVEIAFANPTNDDNGLTPFELLRYVGNYGSSCPVFGVSCTGWVSYEASRTDREVVKLVFSSASGSHEIKVNDGWYALAWVDHAAKRGPNAHLKAYDKDGKVVFRR